MRVKERRQNNFDSNKLMKLINPNNSKILKILSKDIKLNQVQLQKELGVSYRQTQRYIADLSKKGLISKKVMKKERGQPTILSLKK